MFAVSAAYPICNTFRHTLLNLASSPLNTPFDPDLHTDPAGSLAVRHSLQWLDYDAHEQCRHVLDQKLNLRLHCGIPVLLQLCLSQHA